MEKWEFKPTKSVGNISFGMSRDDVHKVIGNDFKEFKKSRFSKNSTDDYGKFHVFYTQDNYVEAVEFFEEIEIYMDENKLFPADIPIIEDIIGTMEEESGSYIQKRKSVGVYAPDGKVESILLGAKGYFG